MTRILLGFEADWDVMQSSALRPIDPQHPILLKSGGTAFLTRTDALRIARQSPIAKLLDEEALRLDVHFAVRADNTSKLVSEFVRTF
jgi:hypothetical protein